MSSLFANSQVSLNWAQNLFPTPLYSYTGRSIITDEMGNIYSCGAFAGTADMDPGSGIFNLTTAGFSDIYIRKQNPSGELIWAKRIGGSQNDLPSSLCMDEHQGIYVTGLFTNNVDFDPGAGTANLSTGSVANADIFVLKLDSAGNYIWSCGMGSTTFQDYGTCITSDLHGHVLVTGYFRQSVDFDPGPNVFTLTSNGSPNVFVLALDSSKNFQWAYANITTANTMSPMVITNHLQEIYVAGSFSGTSDFDPGAGSTVLTSAGNDDLFFQKLNSSGQLIWAKSIGGTGNDNLGDIRVDSSGSIYASGSFKGSMDADPNSSTTILTSNGNGDVFVLKWDANANLIFAKSFGGSSEDRTNGIYIDSSKNIFLTGYFMGNMDLDPGSNIVSVSSNGLTDAFVSKLSANGHYVWGRTFGAYDFDYGYAITGDDSGHVFGLGVYRGNTDLDPDITSYCPDTNQSTYLFKWDQCFVDTQVNISGTTLTASMTGASYQWLNCLGPTYTIIPGATNQSFTPSIGGDYALQISQGNCIDTSSCIKLGAVGVETLSINNTINIYPNPSDDYIEISGVSTGQLLLSDVSGRVYIKHKIETTPSKLFIRDLPSGMYIMVIKSDTTQTMMKLIKK
jgi:frataxin-like iron-binding protein CyaY